MNGEIGRIFDHKTNATKPLPIMQLPGTWELRMGVFQAHLAVLWLVIGTFPAIVQ